MYTNGKQCPQSHLCKIYGMYMDCLMAFSISSKTMCPVLSSLKSGRFQILLEQVAHISSILF